MNETKSIATCEHKLFNCNCWYVATPEGALIHRENNFNLAKKWKDTQSDANQLKLTPWASGREVQER